MSAATSRRPPGRRSRASSLPPALLKHWADEPEWLAALPQLVDECVEHWELDLEEVAETPRSLVVLAGDAVLKLNAPSHHEAEHEADALAFWDGDGAVRLLARDDGRRALLVERCRPGTELFARPEEEVDAVCALLPKLWGEPPAAASFRPVAEVAGGWAEGLQRNAERLEPDLLAAALDAFSTVDPHARSLANQDLHPSNVLQADREPWLVIDPKPLVGERELNGVGLLRNAAWRTDATPVRGWLDALVDLGLDRERLRAWGVAHALAWSYGGTDRRMVDAARAIRDA
jgi:streptomycin 6-kinase